MYICEICKSEHDGSYGIGKFCSKHCQSVYAGRMVKNRVCNFNNSNDRRASYGTWKCSKCNQIFETKKLLINHKREYHPYTTPWNKGLTKETDERIAKSIKTFKEHFENGLILRNKTYTDEERIQRSLQGIQSVQKQKNKILTNPEKIFIKLLKELRLWDQNSRIYCYKL